MPRGYGTLYLVLKTKQNLSCQGSKRLYTYVQAGGCGLRLAQGYTWVEATTTTITPPPYHHHRLHHLRSTAAPSRNAAPVRYIVQYQKQNKKVEKKKVKNGSYRPADAGGAEVDTGV